MKLGSSEVLDDADVDPGTRPEDGDSLPQRLPIVIVELSTRDAIEDEVGKG